MIRNPLADEYSKHHLWRKCLFLALEAKDVELAQKCFSEYEDIVYQRIQLFVDNANTTIQEQWETIDELRNNLQEKGE